MRYVYPAILLIASILFSAYIFNGKAKNYEREKIEYQKSPEIDYSEFLDDTSPIIDSSEEEDLSFLFR